MTLRDPESAVRQYGRLS